MKLIIDIPEDYYEIIKRDVDNHLTDYKPFEIIGKGIPLDDVKAEITDEMILPMADVGLRVALEILDNIGKAESEE